MLSFLQDDALIFVITLATKQRLEVKSKLGFVTNIILDWTVTFSLIVQTCHFALAGNLVSWQSTGSVERHTCRAPHCAVSLQSCCQCVQSHIDSAFRPKTRTPHSHRAMSYTLQNLTPRTGTLSSPIPESVFQQPKQPCEDQPQQSGALTELPPLTLAAGFVLRISVR